MASTRRKRERAGSQRRMQQHQTGASWTTLKLPEGVELFRPGDKRYKLDFTLYQVGSDNPYADEKQWYYERTYYTHRNIGIEDRSYVCPLKTAGKPCPICEERGKLASDSDGDEDLIKALKPSQRQMFLVRDRDDMDKGVQLFDFNYWNFGRTLDELYKEADEDEMHIRDFDDPDKGSFLVVKFSENKPYGMECRSIEFRQRSKPLEGDLLDHGICLDEMLIIPEYDELRNHYFQVEKEEKPKSKAKKTTKDDDEDWDEDEPKPKAKSGKKAVKDDDEEPDRKTKPAIEEGSMVLYDGAEYEVVRVSKDGTSLTLEDSEGDVVRAVDPAEVELVPPKRSAPGMKKDTKVDQKTADAKRKSAADEEWDEDEPRPKRKPVKDNKPKSKKPVEDDDWDD